MATKVKGTPVIPKNKVRSITAMQQDEHCDVADARRTSLVSPDGEVKVDVLTDSNGVHRLAVDIEGDINLNGDVNVDIARPDTPIIQNFTIPVANTEYALALPDNVKRFNISIRGCHGCLRIAHGIGETNTSYKKVPMGAEYSSGEIDMPDNSFIYIQADKAGAIIELESWYIL